MSNESKPLRILFVTPVTPFSTASGSEQRSGLILEALNSLGSVDVLQLTHAPKTQVSNMETLGHRHVQAWVSGADFAVNRYKPKAALTQRIESALNCKMSDYALVVGRYIWPVCQLAIPASTPVIVDLDDFRFRYSTGTPATWRHYKERFLKAVAHQFARRQLRRFSGVFVLSKQDQREVKGLPIAFLPNIPISVVPIATVVPQSNNLLFVGSLWYAPNADAVNWFLRQVWPKVLALCPAATLTLAGAAPQSVRDEWQAHPGVRAPGFIADLADTYRHANLVIVPVHSGGGTNIKVLEAMAHGRPCLVSRFVAQAFDPILVEDRDFLVAETSDEFVERIRWALQKEKEKEKEKQKPPAPDLTVSLQVIAGNGYARVGQQFTRALFHQKIGDIVRRALHANA
jgi:glycosyltransferase involved in cell wall biosynthesis